MPAHCGQFFYIRGERMKPSFNSLGNLYFYPYKNNSVDANDRFFFFELLLSNYAKFNNPEYTKKANAIGGTARSILLNNPFNQIDEKGNTRMKQHLYNAISILETGIQYEYNNERAYIQEKLNNYNRVFGNSDLETSESIAIKSCLESLNNDEGINYAALINLINILFSGLNNTLAIYKHEKGHIENVNELFLKAKESYLNQVWGTTKRDQLEDSERMARMDRAERKFNKNAAKTYLENHTYNVEKPSNALQRRLKKYLQDSEKTSSVILSNKITTFLKKLLTDEKINDIRDIIEQNQLTNEGYKASEMQIRGLLIQQVTEYFRANAANFLTDKDFNFSEVSEDIMKNLLDKSSQSLKFSIRGLYSNFGQFGHSVQFFKTNLNLSEREAASAEGLYNSLLNFIIEISKVKRVRDLTNDQKFVRNAFKLRGKNSDYSKLFSFIKKLENFNNQVKHSKKNREGLSLKLNDDVILTVKENDGQVVIEGLDKLKQLQEITGENMLNFKAFNPQTLSSAISAIKGRMSQKIKNTLIDILKDAEKNNMLSEVDRQLENQLNGIKVSIGGPTYEEIKQQLEESGVFETLWSGKLNIKSDNITIRIAYADNFNFKLEFKPNLKALDPLIEEYYKEYQHQYMDLVENSMQQIAKDKAYTDYQRLAKEFFANERKRDEYLTMIQKKLEEATKALEQAGGNDKKNKIADLEKQIKAQQAFLEDLKNSLYISSTAKTFNNYMDNIGFVGGSIGSNIVNQIDNLNTLFSSAGMPLTNKEINWLIFAAINCSPWSVVGEENIGPVEQILGALSVFALFDEGAAELQILEHILHNTPTQSSTKILHLYSLNGIYYPGSFVLQQALINIKYILNEIEIVSNDNQFRNGVKITSNINISALPNQGGKITDTDPWGTVSQIAIKTTSLHITFLAGLLSIIDGILDELEKIKLPS